MSSSIEITPELMAGFLDEAPEYLEMLDAGLMEFETKAGSGVLALDTDEDREQMTVMFRAAHSLKGLAAAFGFDKIKDLTHLMETLFDQVRMRKRDLSAESFEVLFNVFDRLKALVNELTDDSQPPVAIDDVIEQLNQILEEKPAIAPNPSDNMDDLELPLQDGGVSTESQANAVPVDEPAGSNTEDAVMNGTTEGVPPVTAESAKEVEETQEEASANLESFNDPELAALFVETSAEALDELNHGLLRLEETPQDAELLNQVFRAAHNIKGSSAAVGLIGMNKLTHGMETILDHLRNERIELSEELTTALFSGADKLRAVVEMIRQGQVEDVPMSEREFPVERWMEALPKGGAANADAAQQNAAQQVASIEQTLGDGDSASSESIAAVDSDTSGGPPEDEDNGNWSEGRMRVIVTFASGADDASINAYLIFNKLNDLGTVVSSSPDIDSLSGDTAIETISYIVAEVDDKDGLAAAVQLFPVESVVVTSFDEEETAASDSSLTDGASMPGVANDTASGKSDSGSMSASTPAARSTTPPVSKTSKPSNESEKTAANPSPVADGQSAAAASVSPATTSAPSATQASKASPKPGVGTGSKSKASPAKTGVKTGETLRVDQERLDELMNLGGELVINRARFAQIHDLFREVFDGKNMGYLVDDMVDHLGRLDDTVERVARQVGGHGLASDMRSHLLHVRENFETVRSLVERVHDMRTSMYDFGQALHTLGRVSDGIQKGIMSTRMVPVGPLFTRFKRVVRDICKSTGKQVDLVLIGETTELDKRMIDELGDPLTHMIRNSVDHGIEVPQDRIKAGKPEKGTLTLEACHRGNSICIIVTDDGAGINVERVREKVLERNLATQAQLEIMSDKEIAQFVMQPGFSTAKQVSDLSGRGMGMDIVMAKIDRLNGIVDLDTRVGEGTTVTIKLPLTLAILTAMVSRVGEGIYAIPLEAVAEIITVKRKDIQQIQRRSVVRVRDRVVPVAFFEQVFETEADELQTRTKENAELTLVIIGFEEDQVGLVVDELLGQEDIVIKSIAENYRNVKGFAGASIRGDGSVSLIVDVIAVIEMAAKVGFEAPAPAMVNA